MKKVARILSISILIVQQALAAENVHYVVQNGDTLSAIAQKKIGLPVYPKQTGSLAKIKALNPWLQNGDLIFPGQIIALAPQTQEAKVLSPLAAVSTVEQVAPAAAAHPASTRWPVTEAAPIPTHEALVAPVVKAEQEVPHQLELSAGYAFTSLQGSDPSSGQSAIVQSSHDVNVGALWEQKWTDTFSTAFAGSLRAVDFEPPNNSTKSLSHTSHTLSSMELKFKQQITPDFHLSFGGGAAQELFIQGVSSNLVAVDAFTIPQIFVAADGTIFKIGKTSIGLRGRADDLFSQSTDGYAINSGMAYGAGVFLKRITKPDHSYELNLSYKVRRQNTSVTNFDESQIRADFIIGFPLFEEGSK